jgi:hypothetical protein
VKEQFEKAITEKIKRYVSQKQVTKSPETSVHQSPRRKVNFLLRQA